MTRRLSHAGFDLRLADGFGDDEARAVVDRALGATGDRVHFVMPRPAAPASAADDKPPRLFVKVEFRRPHQALTKRLRPGRAVSEGRGYRFFAQAGLPVPEVFLFGEQSRLRPRAGALVCTEMLRGVDAAQRYRRKAEEGLPRDALTLLARVHAAGLVHGDAVLRNFVAGKGGLTLIDLPRWGRWTPQAAREDVALLVGSSMKLGWSEGLARDAVDAYAAALPADRRLPEGWREAVFEEAHRYRLHVEERDRTRQERHAARRLGFLRPDERRGAPGDAESDDDP